MYLNIFFKKREKEKGRKEKIQVWWTHTCNPSIQ
jgi:hypothetical protein